MMTIQLSSVYPLSTISRGTEDAWDDVIAMCKDMTEDVMIDTNGVQLVQPSLHNGLRELMKNERVHIRIYDMEKEKQSIEAICLLSGLKMGRVENIVYVPVPKPTKFELEVAERAEEMVEFISVDDSKEVAVFDIASIVTQIESKKTLYALFKAIELHSGKCETVPSTYKIKTEELVIAEYIMPEFVKLRVELGNKLSTSIVLDTTNEDIINNIDLWENKVNGHEYTDEERLETIHKELEVGDIGMLVTYKKKRGAVDGFGRSGKGEILSTLPAIFTGWSKESGEENIALFNVYDASQFIDLNSMLDDPNSVENEENEQLIYKTVKVNALKLGMYGLFVGENYHLCIPTQEVGDKTYTIYVADEEGVHIEQVGLPYYIEHIFNQYGIRYNEKNISIGKEYSAKANG